MGPTLDLGNLLVHLRADATQYMLMMGKAEARMRLMSQRMITIGRTMSLYITAPLLLMGGASVKAFASFDDAMTKSLAIMTGITPQLRKEMGELALEISNRGVISATDLARSYFYLASAGLDAKQSMAALGTVERFAVAGAFDMATATDLATDAQSALGLTVKNAQKNMINMTRVTDVLTGANTLANATTEQFSLALTSQAGPAMKAYNIELEEGVAVLAAYADQGIKAQRAGNMMSRMIRLMTKGFKDHRGAWERFNIDIYDTTGELKPLWTIVGDLTRALGDMSTEQKVAALQMLGFQARSQQAILPLMGLGDRIKEYNDELLKMGGITETVTQRQLKSFSSQMKILWNQIRNVGIGIGSILAPALLSLNEKIRRAVAYWNLLEESSKRNVIAFLLVAAAIGPVLIATGLLLKLFAFMIATVNVLAVSFVGLATAMFGPIGVALLLAAIAYTLRAAWVQNLQVIKNRMEDWFNAFSEGFDWLINHELTQGLIEFGRQWVELFKFVGSQADNFIINLISHLTGAWAWLKKVKDGIVNGWDAPTFSQMINEFKRGFEEAGDAWAGAFLAGNEKAEKALEDFKKIVIVGYKATSIQLEGFGKATVEHLQELLEAVKVQFGQDADALIALIQSKMLKLKGENPLGLNPADIAELENAMQKVTKRTKEYNRELEKMKTPIQEWMDTAQDVSTRVGEAFANTFQRMGDTLADFLIEGKADFKSFAKAVLKDLLAILIRAQMVRALTGLFPGLMPGASSAGTVPAGQMPTAVGAGEMWMGMPMHQGGIVPRLHGGLKSDEFPAILQAGETVIPKGGGLAPPNIVINNNTGQAFKQDGEPKWNGREWVVGIITEEINQYGPLRHTIQGIGQNG